MDDQRKHMVKRSIALFVSAYGVLWFVAESLVTFNAAPAFIQSLGLIAYIYMGATSLLFVFLYSVATIYLWPGRTTITICQFHRTVNYLPLYIAQQKGYFQAEGLTVKIIDGNGDDTAWDKVKGDDAQFGVADPLMMLEETNIKGKVVSSIVCRAALWGMTKKSIAPIRDVQELNGKVIAVYRSPSTAYMIITRILKDNQLEDLVTIKQMIPGSEYSVLQAPDVDIVFLPEPMVTVAEMQGAHKVFSATRHFGDFLITGLFVTEKYIKDHPDTVQKVVNALERSLCFIRSNSANAVKMAAKEFTDLPDFAIELATLRLLAEKVIPKHTTILATSWDNCLQVRRPTDAASFPFSAFVDNSFALRAVAKYSS